MHPTLAKTIYDVDPEIAELIASEEKRQRDSVRLIASENYVSGAVLAATGDRMDLAAANGTGHECVGCGSTTGASRHH